MSGPWEQYAAAPGEDGPWSKYTAKETPPTTFAGVARDLAAGAVRGAGSIGATILAPVDAAARALGVQNDFVGRTDRREAMDQALTSLVGADPKSVAYRGGKLVSEIAGTAGVGGALAAGAKALGAAAPVVEALASGGLAAGGATGLSGAALRAGAGAVTGGASAGLVDPSAAASGATVGAALPGVVQVLGAAGKAAKGMIAGPAVADKTLAAAKAAQDAGYVIPPTQVKPTLVNRVMEGAAGKLTTAQNASARNQAVTDRLARQALGLADDAPLTAEALDALRKEAGQAYSAVAGLGALDVGAGALPSSVNVRRFIDPLMQRRAEVDAGELVNAWRQSNHDATAYYRAFARDANPETLAKAKAARAAAGQIDDFLEKRLEAMGQGDMAQALRDARVRIAKSYTVEGAMNPATGSVAAPKLAAQVAKGKAVTGELRQAADFAAAFPTAAKVPEQMGSLPQLSPLDWAAAGGISAAMANPAYLATLFARPAARAAVLSGPVQSRLTVPATAPAISGPNSDALALLFARSAPALTATSQGQR